MLSYIFSGQNIFICLNNKSYTINRNDKRFDDIFHLIKTSADEKEYEKILCTDDNNIKDYCKKYFEGSEIEIGEDTILIDNEPIYGGLCDYIKRLYKNELPLEPVINFVRKLRKNPSYNIRSQLWNFIEACNEKEGGDSFTLDKEGDIIAYKVVTHDYKDKHTGTFDNSIGKVVTMNRRDCDDNPNNTCSTGLHFCAFNYVADFSGCNDRIIIVKVNPEDVVSVPYDYGNCKARCCKYIVIGETEKPLRKPLYEYDKEKVHIDFPDEKEANRRHKEHVKERVMDFLNKANLKTLIDLYEYITDEHGNFNTKDEYIQKILESKGPDPDFIVLRDFISLFLDTNWIPEEDDTPPELKEKFAEKVAIQWLNNVQEKTLMDFGIDKIPHFMREYDDREDIVATIRDHYTTYTNLLKDVADFLDIDFWDMENYVDDYILNKECKEKPRFHFYTEEEMKPCCDEWLEKQPITTLIDFGNKFVNNFQEEEFMEKDDIIRFIKKNYDCYSYLINDISEYTGIAVDSLMGCED